MNVPAEFTIVLLVAMHLVPTSAPASPVTMETAEMIAFQKVSVNTFWIVAMQTTGGRTLGSRFFEISSSSHEYVHRKNYKKTKGKFP